MKTVRGRTGGRSRSTSVGADCPRHPNLPRRGRHPSRESALATHTLVFSLVGGWSASLIFQRSSTPVASQAHSMRVSTHPSVDDVQPSRRVGCSIEEQVRTHGERDRKHDGSEQHREAAETTTEGPDLPIAEPHRRRRPSNSHDMDMHALRRLHSPRRTDPTALRNASCFAVPEQAPSFHSAQ